MARILATERGAVTTVLEQLVSAGALRKTAVPHSKGAAYELVGAFRQPLVQATGSAEPPGMILPGMRLLLVGARDAAALSRVIATIAADPVVVWCARVDGPARLLVAARAEDSNEREQVDRLESYISNAGLDCVQVRVDGAVLDLRALERYARTLTAALRPPELPQA